MLDELKEYNEYTDKNILKDVLEFNKSNLSSKIRKYPRLKYRNFSNGYTGVKRAMFVIAKYFLSNYNQDEEIALNALKAWAGDKYDDKGNEEIKNIAGYIPELLNFYLEDENQTAKNEDKIKKLNGSLNSKHSKKIERFNEDIINGQSKAYEAGISTFNKITYDNIVKRMKRMKLKRNVLVCKKDVLNNVLFQGRKITPIQKDCILKLISSYLLNKKENSNEVFVVLKYVDNWCLRGKYISKLQYFKFDDGKLLFEKNDMSISKTKIKDIHSSLKDNYRLVDFHSLDSIDYGEVVYIDKGNEDILEAISIESLIDKDNIKNILTL